MNYNELINNLIDYGIDNHLITELDSIYIGNLVIDLIKEKEFVRLESVVKSIDKKDNIIRVRSSVCGMLFGYRGGYSRARNILVLDIN